MAYREHIVTFEDSRRPGDPGGWDINHPLWCPGNLLDCVVTQLCRDLTRPPAKGRFWAGAVKVKDHYELVLGDRVPEHVTGTSRRTAYRFAASKHRPQ